jgi:glycogen debranching enzyme
MVRSIASALVIKDGELFFVSDREGMVPCSDGHGYGLYYHDCRYLNGYELKVGEAALNTLVATAGDGYRAVIELTNPQMRLSGGVVAQKESIGVKWERLIDAEGCAMHDVITFHNFSLEEMKLPVSLSFDAAFEDVYEVRSLLDEQTGTRRDPSWDGDTLSFVYDGKDDITRETRITIAPAPTSRRGSDATIEVSLAPRERKQIKVALRLAERKRGGDSTAHVSGDSDTAAIRDRLEGDMSAWTGACASVESDNPFLQRVCGRSLRDLWSLKTRLDGQHYFAAGVPWFVALFGRDSIITSLQMLAFDPGIAEQTLRLLAEYQGTKVDDWRDEQPGKILHELRVGELAHLNEIPHTPYYGSIDSTPLFLILLARHAQWTGSTQVFDDLRDNVERALRWIDEYGDVTGSGYVSYASTSQKGLINQGWKDSGDAIVNADGSLATPPIALVEVQGYVFAAKREIAALFRRSGDDERGRKLEAEANDLRERFERDFWMEDEGAYAMALQKDGSQVAVVSSNAGQVLWSGIASRERGRSVGARLMRDDMFSGWGVRTLSGRADRYNPVGYHLGTVWPHDNSIVAAGFRRYGLDGDACRIFDGLLDAATYFDEYRLPEVFAGFARETYEVPVHYPVACHPQAWAAGCLPYLVQSALGITADAFEQTLRVTAPVLPASTNRVDLKGIAVGDARADLRFERRGEDVRVDVLDVRGNLRVETGEGESF